MPEEEDKAQIEVRRLEKLEPTGKIVVVVDPYASADEGEGRSPGI